jgi:leucine zipper transcription factor-like protein 1
MQLSDAHQSQVATFLSFYRGVRDRSLNDKEKGYLEFQGDRLADDQAIFNRENVNQMLYEYHHMLCQNFRDEMDSIATRSSVYVSQLMWQAEQQGMLLGGADIQACDSPEMAAQVLAMAQSGQRGALPALQKQTLGAIGGSGKDPAMLQEVADAKEEVRVKDDRIMQLQHEMTGLLKERTQMSAELEKMRVNIKQLRSRMTDDPHAAEVDRNVQEAQAMLEAKNAECEAMRQDLQRRLGDSSQFRDLKSIVKKKSDEVKTLRQIMMQHGIQPPGAADDGVDLVADDD